jgi:hypothetical protein
VPVGDLAVWCGTEQLLETLGWPVVVVDEFGDWLTTVGVSGVRVGCEVTDHGVFRISGKRKEPRHTGVGGPLLDLLAYTETVLVVAFLAATGVFADAREPRRVIFGCFLLWWEDAGVTLAAVLGCPPDDVGSGA